MKQKIKLTDNISGKVLEVEKTIRNLDHFEVQRRTRAQVFQDRRFKKPRHREFYC